MNGYEDYSLDEINFMIDALLNEQKEKLKDVEVVYLQCLKRMGKIPPKDYDILRGMFDRIGEVNY